MPITADVAIRQFTGTGNNDALSIGFEFHTADDLTVISRSSAGVSTTLVKDTHYSVAGGGTPAATGTVNVLNGATNYAVGTTWTVVRDEANSQVYDPDSSDIPSSNDLGKSLDRIVSQIQELQEEVRRCIKYPVTDSTGLSAQLTPSLNRLSKAFHFDGTGMPIMVEPTDISGTLVTSTDSTTARYLSDRFAQTHVAEDFGAAGNGTTPDTLALQAMFDEAETTGNPCELTGGKTYITDNLVFGSTSKRLILFGNGATIKAISSLGLGVHMLQNQYTGLTQAPTELHDIVFDGNLVGAFPVDPGRTVSLVRMSDVTGLRVMNCTFQNSPYIACNLSSSDSVIHGNEISGGGYDKPNAGGGAAMWIAGFPGATNVRVSSNNFHDNNFGGLHFSVTSGSVIGNTFADCKESGLFSSRDAGLIDSENIVIGFNTVLDTTANNPGGPSSSSPIETDGRGITIIGNMIKGSDNIGISLNEKSQDVTVVGNTIMNIGALVTPAGAVFINAIGPTDPVKNIIITGNTCNDDQGTPTTDYFLKVAGTVLMENVVCSNNTIDAVVTGGLTATSAWDTQGDTGCRFRDNHGAADGSPDDPDVYFGTAFLTATGTGQPITGVGFKPKSLLLFASIGAGLGTTGVGQVSSINQAGTGAGLYWSSDGAGGNSGAHTTAIELHDSSGSSTKNFDAAFSSFDDDGFTLNVATVTWNALVMFVAWPT